MLKTGIIKVRWNKVFVLAILFLIPVFSGLGVAMAEENSAAPKPPKANVSTEKVVSEPEESKADYSIVNGHWRRSDAQYILKVAKVQSDGKVQVEYLNPRSIKVVQSSVSMEKGLIKLFVKFDDKGYEGSAYKLFYYSQKDALVGYYYQAPTKKTYEVIFLRE